MFNAEKFCIDYQIPYNSKGKKHTRQGWVNIVCPFCSGNPGWHGGFNIEGDYYNCWRCGWHWILKVLSTLLKLPINKVIKIKDQYTTGGIIKKEEEIYADKIKLPGTNLRLGHIKYLKQRRYRPEEIINTWKIKGTDHRGDYKFRIIIPIYLDGVLISYTGRDITGKSKTPYKACEKEKEVYHHKYSLYGIDQVPKDKCLIVEGPLDVWRFGPGAVATFGIGFTLKQVKLIIERFKEIFILYDPGEEQAYQKAKELYALISKQRDCELILGDKDDPDPGDMSDRQARELKKEIGL